MPSQKTHTLVLDMDQTLVHSMFCREKADFCVTREDGGVLYVRRRPYLQKFLERVAELFHVVIFTASYQNYADKVLSILDPENKLFTRRFYNDSCGILSDSYGYVKDLTVLDVDLAKVVMIDDLPHNFRLQQKNGIPIKTWLGDSSDQELVSLLPFLETLVAADDVRPIIAKRFGYKNHEEPDSVAKMKINGGNLELILRCNEDDVEEDITSNDSYLKSKLRRT